MPGDWKWFNGLRRASRAGPAPDALGAGLRDQVLAVAGNPAAFGGLAPGDDILASGLSQSQHYLSQVAEGGSS